MLGKQEDKMVEGIGGALRLETLCKLRAATYLKMS